jgi:hypothetical protein
VTAITVSDNFFDITSCLFRQSAAGAVVSRDSVFVHVKYNKISDTGWQPELQCFGCMEDDMSVGRIILPGLLCILASLYAKDADARSLQDEQQCLALAIYWEARGEGRQGMIAVGWTILNRARSEHFPATPCGVVYQGGERSPCQFSWWCDGKSDRPRDRNSWTRARIIAAELLVDPPRDPTNGALFFHSKSIPVPWARMRVRTARIGNHIFYR